jgi:hypothetical protein
MRRDQGGGMRKEVVQLRTIDGRREKAFRPFLAAKHEAEIEEDGQRRTSMKISLFLFAIM